MTRHTMEGRAPLQITGNRLLFMSRDGNSLRLHDASVDSTFKSLDEVKVCLNLGTHKLMCSMQFPETNSKRLQVLLKQFSTHLQNCTQ